MLSDSGVGDLDHYNPTTRTLEIEKQASETNCGFDLTRSKWDPYPWVSSVENGSAAHTAGLKNGDCVLEVNGEDIIGQRISDVAHLVKKNSHVTLLLWNVGVDPFCSPETLCCGPMPSNLQRLIACISSILNVLECPICLDTIPPPCYQCDNGHLICMRCRTKSEKCPVCRMRLSKGRSILADHVYNTVTEVFGLKEATQDERNAKINLIFRLKVKNKNIPDIKITTANSTNTTSKFFSKFHIGKSSSVENLSTNKPQTSTLSLNDNEFNSNFKMKSLSTNEIFHVSPSVSRSGSVTRINKRGSLQSNSLLNTNDRSHSCHGSYEYLNVASTEDIPVSSTPFLSGTINYRCPYEEKCSSVISEFPTVPFTDSSCSPEAVPRENGRNVDREGSSSKDVVPVLPNPSTRKNVRVPSAVLNYYKCPGIIEHFQDNHNGPLIQYFQSPIKLTLDDLLHGKHITYLITIDKHIFILKSIHTIEIGNIHLWMWCMGDKAISNQYQMFSKIYNRENKQLLSIHTSIHALSDVTWQEIITMEKGVILSETLITNMITNGIEVILEICIHKN